MMNKGLVGHILGHAHFETFSSTRYSHFLSYFLRFRSTFNGFPETLLNFRIFTISYIYIDSL